MLVLGWGCDTSSFSVHCINDRTLLPYLDMWTIYEGVLSTSSRCPPQPSQMYAWLCFIPSDEGEEMASNSSSPQQSLGFARQHSLCVCPLWSSQHSPVGSIAAAFLPGKKFVFLLGNTNAHNCCLPSAITNTGSELKQAHPELQFCAEVLVTLY